jgi:dTDP-4-dehydrorhamnose reductase
MQILLTGITGQIGGALLEPLARLATVRAVNRTSLDLARPSEIPRILDEFAPDLIVNPAAYTAVDQAECEQELAYCVNAEAPQAMARWAARNNVPMVHFSTDYVFSGIGDQPWREDDPTAPVSVYAVSKLAGEEEVRKAGGSHLIIRTSWVFASRGKNFLNTIERLAREKDELRIVADQVGSPTSARSLAEALTCILAIDETANIGEIARMFERADGLVHMSNSGETSWYGFACAIVDGLRNRGAELTVNRIVPITSNEFPTPAQRPHNSRLDLSRLEKVFAVRMSNWQDALDQELNEMFHCGRQFARPLAGNPEPARE